MKQRFMIWLSKPWKKNEGTDYPQTWYYMPPRWSKRTEKHHLIGHPLRCLLEFLCCLMGGHELSKTEWSYGGGDFADRYCRWCDKPVLAPKESIFFQFKEVDAMSLIKEMGEDGIALTVNQGGE